MMDEFSTTQSQLHDSDRSPLRALDSNTTPRAPKGRKMVLSLKHTPSIIETQNVTAATAMMRTTTPQPKARKIKLQLQHTPTLVKLRGHLTKNNSETAPTICESKAGYVVPGLIGTKIEHTPCADTKQIGSKIGASLHTGTPDDTPPTPVSKKNISPWLLKAKSTAKARASQSRVEETEESTFMNLLAEFREVHKQIESLQIDSELPDSGATAKLRARHEARCDSLCRIIDDKSRKVWSEAKETALEIVDTEDAAEQSTAASTPRFTLPNGVEYSISPMLARAQTKQAGESTQVHLSLYVQNVIVLAEDVLNNLIARVASCVRFHRQQSWRGSIFCGTGG